MAAYIREFDIVTKHPNGSTDIFRATKIPDSVPTYKLSLFDGCVLFSVSQIDDLVEGLQKLKKLHEP